MNFGLRDFFVGIVHLFVIFLPGFVVVLAIMHSVPTLRDIDDQLGIGSVGSILLIVGASYFFGHLLSLIASTIEDKWPNRSRRLERGEVKAAIRRTAYDIVKHRLGNDVMSADSLRKWCALIVRKEEGVLQAGIDAKDADRRFFRNIRLVLLLLVVIAAWQSLFGETSHVYVVVAFAMLTILAHLRYINQDTKFTQLAFESLIVMDTNKREPGESPGSASTHAGGVVFRKESGAIEFLLIRPRNGKEEWVLPKGHVKEGESPEAAAVREVEEEAGITTKICYFIDFSYFKVRDEEVCLANYLMKYFDEVDGPKEDRQCVWRNFAKACEDLSHKESRLVLRRANKLL